MTVDPQDLVRAGVDALQQRNRDRAAEIFAHLIRGNAPIGDSWETVARAALAAGEGSLALNAQRRFIALNTGDAKRQWELGVIMLALGRTTEAIDLSRQLVSRAPNAAVFYQLLGNAYAQAGESEKALEVLRRGLTLQPNVAESWLAYVQLKTFSTSDPELGEIRKIAASMPATPAGAAGTMQYVLGKALDDSGDYEGAFKAFEAGARLIGQDNRYDRAGAEAFVNDVTANWTKDFAASLTSSAVTTDEITFVLGLPRSGTTLTEQILVSHSAVSEGAETSLFARASLAFPDMRPATVQLVAGEPRWEGDIWTRIGQSYVHLMRDRFGPNGRLVDKTVSNVNLLGAIAQALPNAKFVWLRRDPAATAWSCFSTCFGGNVRWSWSLADIGHQFRLNDRLFAHWSALYPDRILALQYEDLVNQPDATIPRLLNFIGLKDEPQTRAFHEAQRNVRTASIAQARQPLYSSALTRWKRYEKHMAPFFEAYSGG